MQAGEASIHSSLLRGITNENSWMSKKRTINPARTQGILSIQMTNCPNPFSGARLRMAAEKMSSPRAPRSKAQPSDAMVPLKAVRSPCPSRLSRISRPRCKLFATASRTSRLCVTGVQPTSASWFISSQWARKSSGGKERTFASTSTSQWPVSRRRITTRPCVPSMRICADSTSGQGRTADQRTKGPLWLVPCTLRGTGSLPTRMATTSLMGPANATSTVKS